MFVIVRSFAFTIDWANFSIETVCAVGKSPRARGSSLTISSCDNDCLCEWMSGFSWWFVDLVILLFCTRSCQFLYELSHEHFLNNPFALVLVVLSYFPLRMNERWVQRCDRQEKEENEITSESNKNERNWVQDTRQQAQTGDFIASFARAIFHDFYNFPKDSTAQDF